MSLLDNESVKRVEMKLKEFNPTMDIIILNNTAKTALEAASSLGCEIGAIVKSLLFKTENDFVLCLIPGDKKASINRIKKTLRIKDVSMASANEVKKVTGFSIGGVSPIGHTSKTNILMDSSLERFKSLFAAAGHPNCIFKINFNDLEKITNSTIEEISE